MRFFFGGLACVLRCISHTMISLSFPGFLFSLQGKMDQAMKNIEKLLKTKDRCQLATIFILVVIFVIVTAIAVS
jgi:hypothetical protein